ncbi:MAG: hypothetical protein CVV42_09805 [Candidatus Riflebacteria bacterium HGW-Riflebacteria-2]|jgi:hypothetical protein|nr:MAG: hypothetical protein CVV42_09805 [Candidatus Riflebacteria bacterium HGW-Riflebacteria-2]
MSRNLVFLPTAIGGWILLYLAALFYPATAALPQQIAVFVAATILTLASALIVAGFSRLKQHRNVYLLIGFLGLAATFYCARPLVNRSQLLNRSGDIPGHIISITSEQHGLAGVSESLLLALRNANFKEINSQLEEEFPESAWLILMLAMAQLTLASGIGLWIGEGIDEIAHLLPVAIVATVADIWSVSAGATAKIVVSSAINYFLLRFPMPGYGTIPYLIGLTDFLFFAIFFQAAVRFNLGIRKNVLLLLTSFFIAVAAAIFFGHGLPVLPFMALLFVVGNFRHLSLKKEEFRQILLFVVFIIIAFTLISKFAH